MHSCRTFGPRDDGTVTLLKTIIAVRRSVEAADRAAMTRSPGVRVQRCLQRARWLRKRGGTAYFLTNSKVQSSVSDLDVIQVQSGPAGTGLAKSQKRRIAGPGSSSASSFCTLIKARRAWPRRTAPYGPYRTRRKLRFVAAVRPAGKRRENEHESCTCQATRCRRSRRRD